MNRLLEPRWAIDFYVKLGKTGKEIHAMLKAADGDNAMCRPDVFEWRKLFRECKSYEDVEDAERSERPSTSTRDKSLARDLQAWLDRDNLLNATMVSNEFGIPTSDIRPLVTECMGMRKVCAKLVPRLLSDEKKNTRTLTYQELLDHASATLQT
ncbi:protein GVQW3-like [Hetaerina americana]|uniref:protein GVQW3-like n=1 Tax=Hetaerina americana TaxID=62018 RepID=UPI003A7F4C3D